VSTLGSNAQWQRGRARGRRADEHLQVFIEEYEVEEGDACEEMRPDGSCNVRLVTGVKRLDSAVAVSSVTIFHFRMGLGRTARCGLHFGCCQGGTVRS
jgi:hypothetical protein